MQKQFSTFTPSNVSMKHKTYDKNDKWIIKWKIIAIRCGFEFGFGFWSFARYPFSSLLLFIDPLVTEIPIRWYQTDLVFFSRLSFNEIEIKYISLFTHNQSPIWYFYYYCSVICFISFCTRAKFLYSLS